MWNYSDKLKDHFYNPRNVGEMNSPSAIGEVGSIVCGDALKLFLKIEAGRIVDAKFQTFGCGSAIASASALTEMVKGLTIEEAKRIGNEDIANFLGGIPKEKMHCSVMGQEALADALNRFSGGSVRATKADDEGVIVCQCFSVTDKKIRRVALENDLHTAEDIKNYTKAGGACGSCVPAIEDLLRDIWKERARTQAAGERPASEPGAPAKISNLKRIKLIEEVIDNQIKPAMIADGGDIELVDIVGNEVKVSLRGKCIGCMASGLTIKHFVEAKLKELVDDELTVVEV